MIPISPHESGIAAADLAAILEHRRTYPRARMLDRERTPRTEVEWRAPADHLFPEPPES